MFLGTYANHTPKHTPHNLPCVSPLCSTCFCIIAQVKAERVVRWSAAGSRDGHDRQADARADSRQIHGRRTASEPTTGEAQAEWQRAGRKDVSTTWQTAWQSARLRLASLGSARLELGSARLRSTPLSSARLHSIPLRSARLELGSSSL